MTNDLIKALRDTLARPSCQFLRIDREAASRLLAVLEAPAEGAGEYFSPGMVWEDKHIGRWVADVEEDGAAKAVLAAQAIGEDEEQAIHRRELIMSALRARSSAPEAREGEAVGGLDAAQLKAAERAAMDAGAYSWRNARLAMVEGDKVIGYPAFSRADMAELARLFTHPAAPSADKLRIAVEALEQWKCGSCDGGEYLNRTKSGSEKVACKVCKGSGQHPAAAKALAALKAEGA